MEDKKLKFGILCNGLYLQQWQWQAVQYLLDHPQIELVLLVVNDDPVAKPGFSQKLKKYPFRQLVFRLFYKYLVKIPAFELVDIIAISKKVRTINCHTTKKGFGEYFYKEDIAEIKAHQPDFLLRFGFSILKGEILNAATYGIWSFHHNDEQKYRGGPAGVWEIMNNDPVNGAILQRLTEKLDAGVILKKGYFKTIDHSYVANYQQLLQQSAIWPLQVCKDIISGNDKYLSAPPSVTKAPVYKVPSNRKAIQFIFKLLSNKLKFHYKELFESEEWNIAVGEKPISRTLSEGITNDEVVWASAPMKNTFRADPFAIAAEGHLDVYYEEYLFQKRKANINHIQYQKRSFSKPEAALEKLYHLSYPYLFQYEGTHYCIPEGFQNKSIDLYLIENKKLVFERTIINNIEAVDPTIFNYNGRWWLFCTKAGIANTHLFAFYADDPFGEFNPHNNNPIKIDIRSSRPAGTPFQVDGQWYRPAQDCAETYGAGVVIQKIIELTPNTFIEEPVRELKPLKGRYNKGLHTLAAAGEFTLIDGKTFIFNFEHFKYQLSRKWNKVRSKSSI